MRQGFLGLAVNPECCRQRRGNIENDWFFLLTRNLIRKPSHSHLSQDN